MLRYNSNVLTYFSTQNPTSLTHTVNYQNDVAKISLSYLDFPESDEHFS